MKSIKGIRFRDPQNERIFGKDTIIPNQIASYPSVRAGIFIMEEGVILLPLRAFSLRDHKFSCHSLLMYVI